MSGIPILHRDGTMVHHSSVWAGGDEVPVVFIVVKDGATAIAHPDYIANLLHEVSVGGVELDNAFDFLMIKTPDLWCPKLCQVRMITGGGDGAAEILIGKRVVHKFS